MIIDGKDAVLGRLSTFVARKLLEGNEINIINANDIIITGNKKKVIEKYTKKRQRGSPQHGPFFPKTTTGIVRRTIRGMLPKNRKGRRTLKLLSIQTGNKKVKEEKVKKIANKPIKTDYITIKKLSEQL